MAAFILRLDPEYGRLGLIFGTTLPIHSIVTGSRGIISDKRHYRRVPRCCTDMILPCTVLLSIFLHHEGLFRLPSFNLLLKAQNCLFGVLMSPLLLLNRDQGIWMGVRSNHQSCTGW
jgi:hypothetical protein